MSKQGKPGVKKSTGKKSGPYEEAESLLKAEEGQITYWLGMPSHKNFKTGFDAITLSEEGISKSSIDQLTTHLGISKKYMAEDVLGISVKTIERKNANSKMDKRSSSHALEIARVVQHAYRVFGDEHKLRKWLNAENRSLNNQKPVSLFATLTGLGMVNDILGRIEEGIYS